MMMNLLLVAAVSLVGQIPNTTTDARPTYVIHLKNGETIAGYIKGDQKGEKADPLVIELDVEPRKEQKEQKAQAGIASIEPESRLARDQRRREAEEQWKESLSQQGIVKVHGVLRDKNEVYYANQAKALAAQHAALSRPPVSDSGAPTAPPPPPPGFLRQWGSQLLVLLLGLGLAGVILKTLILSGNE